MTRMANMYDVSKCTACRACQVACKDWNQLPAVIEPFKGNYQTHEDTNADTYTIIRFLEHEDNQGIHWNFLKYQCMHCFDPECMKVCPTGCISITDFGAVIKDYDKCIGCNYCTYACPFEIPKYRSREDKTYKCTLCYERIQEGLTPACVRTCPTGALKFGERDKLLEEARARVKFLQSNGFPRATIYGNLELGGLNMLYVLTDSPDKFGLPVNPQPAKNVGFWQDWVQPYFAWLIPLALLGSAASFVSSRTLAKKYTEQQKELARQVEEGGQE